MIGMARMVIHADQDGSLHAEALFRGDHGRRSTCPGCERDLSRLAIVGLAYVFTACDCPGPGYPHLVEQLWHRACLAAS